MGVFNMWYQQFHWCGCKVETGNVVCALPGLWRFAWDVALPPGYHMSLSQGRGQGSNPVVS